MGVAVRLHSVIFPFRTRANMQGVELKLEGTGLFLFFFFFRLRMCSPYEMSLPLG